MAFITIRRRVVIAVLAIIVALVTVGATAAGVTSANRAVNGFTIVIDAGHGGADGGVTGITTGTKESDINLALAKELSKYFKQAGYEVVLTRSDSGAVGGGIKYNKRQDMQERKAIINAACPDLVLSIHCNSYPVKSVKGAQVFYASNRGEPYAAAIQSYFNELLNTKPRSIAVGDYYMLNCSDYPSVLCECGFMSNPEEEQLLITSEYREKVAYTIFTAIDSVFGEKT